MAAEGGGETAEAGGRQTAIAPVVIEVPAAVTVAAETNAVAVPLRAVAAVPVEDVRFEFDSSFLLPDATRALERVAPLRERLSGTRMTVFGHADRVGDDAYNKRLAGRRARSVYAVLIRDGAIWEDLFQDALGGDNWRGRPVQYMLQALGFDPGPIDGVIGNNTKKAVRAFQRDATQPETGNLNPTTRAELFKLYMDHICRGPEGRPFKLTATDFLGRGQDADGRADYQGCGEFNPILIMSRSQVRATNPPGQENQRNFGNAVNRRVTSSPPGSR
jgi:hypothetical protein